MKVKTCLRYPGGKFYASNKIKKFLEIKHDEYREVFAGGLSVFLAKELAPKLNWINDIDKDLINFYKIIQNQDARKQLYQLLDKEVANRDRHKEVKERVPKTKIEEAFRFFYLNRTSFSGIMKNPRWGFALGSSIPPYKWTKTIEPVAQKLKDVKITNLDFSDVILAKSENSGVLMYLDPPYYNAAKSLYTNDFKGGDHIRLANLLRETRFKFVLSYDDCPGVRKLYDWANISQINFTYFMSEGRRKKTNEVVITNFKANLLHYHD